jgi:hypothetical protein
MGGSRVAAGMRVRIGSTAGLRHAGRVGEVVDYGHDGCGRGRYRVRLPAIGGWDGTTKWFEAHEVRPEMEGCRNGTG